MRKKKCKNFILGIVIIISLLALTACGLNKRISIDTFVLENEDILRKEIATAIDSGTVTSLETIKGVPGYNEGIFTEISDRRSDDGSGFIYFECEAYGLMTSSRHSGFYYSTEDIHSERIFWMDVKSDNLPNLSTEENVWDFRNENPYASNDNFLYTYKICDNFYYFSIGN